MKPFIKLLSEGGVFFNELSLLECLDQDYFHRMTWLCPLISTYSVNSFQYGTELKCVSIASVYHKVCVLHSSLLSLFICVIPQSFEKDSLISWRICVVCTLNSTNPLFVASHHLAMTSMLLSEMPFCHPSTFPVPLTLFHLSTGIITWKMGMCRSAGQHLGAYGTPRWSFSGLIRKRRL